MLHIAWFNVTWDARKSCFMMGLLWLHNFGPSLGVTFLVLLLLSCRPCTCTSNIQKMQANKLLLQGWAVLEGLQMLRGF